MCNLLNIRVISSSSNIATDPGVAKSHRIATENHRLSANAMK